MNQIGNQNDIRSASNSTNFYTQQNFNKQQNANSPLNNNMSQSGSNNSNNNINTDEDVVETVVKKEIIKSKKVNYQNAPSYINNSKIHKSYWQGDSFDDGNDIEKRRNKILNMIKNAHVERLKNSVLLKEINNAHDEVERLANEGEFASSKMMETELNNLQTNFILSNLNSITKSKLGKTAFYGSPYSSFNKSQFNTFKGQFGRTMITDEKKFYEFSKKSKREKANKSKRIEEEENIEKVYINTNKKGKKGNRSINNNQDLNNLEEQGEDENDENKGINENNENFNIKKNNSGNDNKNNQNFNPNSEGNNENREQYFGNNNNDNEVPNNNNLRNIKKIDKNGNIQITGNKSVNNRYIRGNNNEIIIINENDNNEIRDSNNNIQDDDGNKKKKKKKKLKKKILNGPQGNEDRPSNRERRPDESYSENDSEEDDDEEQREKLHGARVKKIINEYSENEIFEENQGNPSQENPNYPNQNYPIGNEPVPYSRPNNNKNPNDNPSNLSNLQQPNSFPRQDGFPNNYNPFTQNNPKFPNAQNPNIPYQNPPFDNNTLGQFPNQSPGNPNQPGIQNINPNLMPEGIFPKQFYPTNPKNPSPLNPNYFINYPQHPDRDRPFYGFGPSRPRPKSAKGPLRKPDIYYNYKNGPDPYYPRRPNLDFGKPLTIIDRKWKNSKSKKKRKMPAEIYYREGLGNCFACDNGYGISRSGNSPNNYNPYRASEKVIRKDNNIYIDNGRGYYQYRSKQYDYI